MPLVTNGEGPGGWFGRCQSQDQFDDDFDDCEFAEKSEFIAGLTGEMQVYLLGMCIWCSST
jgi:hypothetical protein